MWFSGRASPSTTEEDEVLEEGEGCARGRVRLPSLSLTIYRGKGGWRRHPRVPQGMGGGHGENPRWVWAPPPLGNLPPSREGRLP